MLRPLFMTACVFRSFLKDGARRSKRVWALSSGELPTGRMCTRRAIGGAPPGAAEPVAPASAPAAAGGAAADAEAEPTKTELEAA